MILAFIGIGNVGFALAHNLQRKGHQIIIANNNTKSESVLGATKRNPNLQVMPIQEAIDNSEAVFLATPFNANEALLKNLNFNGKALVDCTNPVGPGISHGLESKISGAEKVQEWAKDASVVKSYTIYGYENLENPNFPNYDTKPTMMIAGNDHESKNMVQKLNTDLGYDTLDVGDLSQALHLEHMTLLWVKMARRDGHHPNFAWAYLEK